MKATLRSSAAAAALLLAPLGAMLVSQPAAAQHGYGYAQPGYVYPQPAVVAEPDFRRDADRWEHRDHRYRRDDRGPWIADLAAAQGARGWTRIAARFGDQGSGVDPASVVLRIDGRDVTGRARVDQDDVRYAEDLRPGRHMAELVVRDRAGNASRRSWFFDVASSGRHHGGDGYRSDGYRDDGYRDGGQRW